MAIDTFSLATELGVLLGARDPSWRTQTVSDALTDPPAALTDGAFLEDAPKTLLSIALRENVAYRTVRLGMVQTATTGSVTFTATIGGTAVTYNTGGIQSRDLAMAGLAAAINANGTVAALVTALAVRALDDATTVGVRDSVRLRGVGSADYTVNFADDDVAVTVTATGDAADAVARLFFTLRGATSVTPPTGWRRALTSYNVPNGGFVERFDTAGLDRMFVQLSTLSKVSGDGSVLVARTPDIHIGPCVLES